MRYDTIEQALEGASSPYDQLVIVVGHEDVVSPRLKAFAHTHEHLSINVGSQLSTSILPLTTSERQLQARAALDDIIGDRCPLAILDRTPVLFDVSLKLDPLSVLKHLARRRTIVAAWPGRCEGASLVYAEPTHREFRSYPSAGLRLVIPQP